MEIKGAGPRISVIIAVYNAERYFEDCLCSIFEQTYQNIQLIIIDGNSTDRTLDIAKKYQPRIDVLVSEEDDGVYDAWNKGLARADGDWMCFLGADDFFDSKATLRTVVPFLETAGKMEIRYVYGLVEHIKPESLKPIEVVGKPWDALKKDIKKNMVLVHCGSFHHRSLFELNGQFDKRFKIAGDYEFLLREFKDQRNQALFAPVPVVKMRNGGISGSLKNRLVLVNELIEARKVNQIQGFSWPLFWWKIRVVVFQIFARFLGASFSNKLADLYRAIMLKKSRWT